MKGVQIARNCGYEASTGMVSPIAEYVAFLSKGKDHQFAFAIADVALRAALF